MNNDPALPCHKILERTLHLLYTIDSPSMDIERIVYLKFVFCHHWSVLTWCNVHGSKIDSDSRDNGISFNNT